MEAQYSAAHNEQEILSFADKYLAPYRVLRKSDDSAEVVPNLCPFCHGGDHEDQNTFALSVDKGVFVCKRGSCGKRGTFEQLVDHFTVKLHITGKIIKKFNLNIKLRK